MLTLNSDCAIPVLPARNLQETVEFYQNLGFETHFDPESQDAYAIIIYGTLELHFSLLPEIIPSESYAECYLRVSQVDELYRKFQAQSLPFVGIPRIGRLENKPWGMREFYIIDPSGNLLKIGQVLTGGNQ